ncbi:hypothetical protein E4U60_002510 [Claviceps pazoutovae]|uniref:Uncharacterized protein n=1 Tax=Claviceps pazoutovae TaxID=1649127 RepID=A0A9P7SFS7_9HYPO|nr:hypothetical protein E4U60_002510 [Claviceps pazoutovae]
MSNHIFQQHHRREGMKGQCLLKLMQFAEHLSGFPGSKANDDISYWNGFVARFFSTNGVFRHSLHITEDEQSMDKQYEIAFAAIARYLHTYFVSGVRSMQLIMDKGLTDRPSPGDFHCIENQRASFVYWFDSGAHLVSTGSLRVQFDNEQKIDLFEFITTGHEEYISRKLAIEAAKPAHMWFKEWHKVNSHDNNNGGGSNNINKTSPELSKKPRARQLKSPQTHPPDVLADLPDSAVTSKGVPFAVHQFLEIVEVMGQMNPLISFCHSYPGIGPFAALDQYVANYISGPNTSMNGQQQGPLGVPRTPSLSQFAVGASPAVGHMNLPATPHISSPAAHVPMQTPGMQMQPSQQGTTSRGPSVSTSPGSNKRRRASAVKMEDDGPAGPQGGLQLNGVGLGRGKPATPRMPKRVKINPS